MAPKRGKKRIGAAGAEKAVPPDLIPIEPAHAARLKELFETAGARAWCCFTPFLFFTSRPGRNQVFWKEYRGTPVILYRKTRDGSARWDLYTLAANSPETARYAVELMDSFNGDRRGRILWVGEPQLRHIEGIATLAPAHRDSEYFYDTALVSRLEGPVFADVRKRVNRFTREHPGHEVLPMTAAHVAECHALHGEWMRRYDSRERTAPLLDHFYTETALDRFGDFAAPDLYGWVVIENGRIAGFAMAGAMSRSLANFFVLKTNPDLFGLSTYFRWRVLETLGRLGFRFVNDASDLNVPGLKRHKAKFRPVEHLRIFRVDRVDTGSA